MLRDVLDLLVLSGNQAWLAGKSSLNGSFNGNIIINVGFPIHTFDYRRALHEFFKAKRMLL